MKHEKTPYYLKAQRPRDQQRGRIQRLGWAGVVFLVCLLMIALGLSYIV